MSDLVTDLRKIEAYMKESRERMAAAIRKEFPNGEHAESEAHIRRSIEREAADEIERLRREIAEAKTGPDWLEMDVAPKDGTAIIIFIPSRGGYFADQRFIVAKWTGWGGGVWEAASGMGKYDEQEASHWRPLPPIPTAIRAKAEPQTWGWVDEFRIYGPDGTLWDIRTGENASERLRAMDDEEAKL